MLGWSVYVRYFYNSITSHPAVHSVKDHSARYRIMAYRGLFGGFDLVFNIPNHSAQR